MEQQAFFIGIKTSKKGFAACRREFILEGLPFKHAEQLFHVHITGGNRYE